MKTIKDFNNQEIDEMIQKRGLKLTCVVTVKSQLSDSSYLMIKDSEENFEKDKELFNLLILEEKYMLLTMDEIIHINNEGYFNETY